MTMTTTATKLAKHVSDLAAAFNVRLQVVPGMPPDGACAGWDKRDMHKPQNERRFMIIIAPVTCEATYAVAMHELGHCLSPLGYLTPVHATTGMRERKCPSTLRDVQLQLEEEHAAWEWAHHYTLSPLGWTPTMQQVENIALESYHKHARQYGVKAPRR